MSKQNTKLWEERGKAKNTIINWMRSNGKKNAILN